MSHLHVPRIAAVSTLCLIFVALTAAQAPTAKKPEVVLTANPVLGFTPAKVRFSAALRGGDDDYEPFYCASIEWEWDDGTRSESTADCEPYEAGKSHIRRAYTAEHTYDAPDAYRPTFRLKKRNKVVAQATTDIEVRPGH